MRHEGTIRKVCPRCAGAIQVSVLHQISYNYVITKSGKLSTRYTKAGPYPLDAMIACCTNEHCGANWGTNDFIIDEDDRFVDFKYDDDEE